MKTIYANGPSRWTRYCSTLMAALTKIKRSSTRHKGRRTKHIYDWIVHAHNLAKGASPATHRDASSCKFCGETETQQHQCCLSAPSTCVDSLTSPQAHRTILHELPTSTFTAPPPMGHPLAGLHGGPTFVQHRGRG
jgi:hypothetical protein